MKMYGSICGVAAALSLVAFTAATPAAARGGYGWKADYVGNEWINDNIAKSRSATESDEDSRPTRKAQRTSRAAPADSDTPAPRASRRIPKSEETYSGGSGESGVASYYWQPQRVASGGWFNPDAMTAAHKTLPFGTKVRVTHRGSGRSVTVTINDRGPYVTGRVIDLSRAAASSLGMTGSGIAQVQLTVLGR